MNGERHRVSVLMPVYNTVRYLEDALDSILDQSFTDFEFLVINDGSSDGSTQILRAFAEKEPRIRLIERENRGLIATRNELLQAAECDLIAWMDSDDISIQDRLALQVERFDADPELVCLGGAAQRIDPEGHVLNLETYAQTHEEILVEQEKGGAMRFATTMMRRNIAIRVGGFREPFKIGEDFDLLLRMSEVGKMANLPNLLYQYRQHLTSVFSSDLLLWPAYRDQILELSRERRATGSDKLQRGETLRLDSSRPIAAKDARLHSYTQWANLALQIGKRGLAWKYAVLAVAEKPLSRMVWATVLRVLRNRRNT